MSSEYICTGIGNTSWTPVPSSLPRAPAPVVQRSPMNCARKAIILLVKSNAIKLSPRYTQATPWWIVVPPSALETGMPRARTSSARKNISWNLCLRHPVVETHHRFHTGLSRRGTSRANGRSASHEQRSHIVCFQKTLKETAADMRRIREILLVCIFVTLYMHCLPVGDEGDEIVHRQPCPYLLEDKGALF